MTVEEILAGESKNLEFKIQRPKDSTKYMKSVVAFANGQGGQIVFGVDDKTRTVVGIPKKQAFAEADAITTAISDSCEPVIIPDVYLQTLEDKTIIIVDIAPGKQRPYYIKSMGIRDGVFIRVSGTSRPADRDLAAEMYYEDEGRSYDMVIRKDLTVSDAKIQNLCTEMKKVAVRNARSEAQKREIKDLSRNNLLSWGLLAEDEKGEIHPTNGYVYLTGGDPLLSMIQCGMFKGTTRAVFVDKREYTGTLWKQIDEAHHFVLRNIHLGARIRGIYRQDIYEFPPDSIREIIINAVMNCSFLQASHIQVAVYDDRLEITSPGGLMPGVTLDRMREGYSKIRNKALAHAFLYMNMIEEWGSGIPKLIEEMHNYGLRDPEFIDMEIGFRVNLYRAEVEASTEKNFPTEIPTESDNPTEIPTEVSTESDNPTEIPTEKDNPTEKDAPAGIPTEQKILELIRENPSLTFNEIAIQIGVSKDVVRYAMQKLRKNGTVIREGSQKKGKWLIANE